MGFETQGKWHARMLPHVQKRLLFYLIMVCGKRRKITNVPQEERKPCIVVLGANLAQGIAVGPKFEAVTEASSLVGVTTIYITINVSPKISTLFDSNQTR